MKLAISCDAFAHDGMYFEFIPSSPPRRRLPSEQSDRTSVSCEPWANSPNPDTVQQGCTDFFTFRGSAEQHGASTLSCILSV